MAGKTQTKNNKGYGFIIAHLIVGAAVAITAGVLLGCDLGNFGEAMTLGGGGLLTGLVTAVVRGNP